MSYSKRAKNSNIGEILRHFCNLLLNNVSIYSDFKDEVRKILLYKSKTQSKMFSTYQSDFKILIVQSEHPNNTEYEFTKYTTITKKQI